MKGMVKVGKFSVLDLGGEEISNNAKPQGMKNRMK